MKDSRKTRRRWKPGVLRELGVYGLDRIEDSYLAGLALRDPTLLVGGVGQAKTLLVERTAQALRLRFCVYPAEKAMFEDILGPFDPRALLEGRVGYLRTDVTIWDKEIVLVDELSRANPAMQNKWLEVIRSRRVMGKELVDLRYVLAAMNPPGLLGSHPLDEALAGRFTFLLPFPEVLSMDEADQRRVVESRSSADAAGLGPVEQAPLPDLEALLEAVRREFGAVERELGTATTTYVLKVAEYLASKEIQLDGRRLGMMRRGLLGLVAVGRVLGTLPTASQVPLDLYRKGLDMTMPFPALGKPLPAIRADGAHGHAAAALDGKTRRLLPLSDLLAAARAMVGGGEAWADVDTTSLLVTRICTAVERPMRMEAAAQAGAALLVVATRHDALARVRGEARHRLLACWREVCSVAPGWQTDFADQASSMDLDTTLDETTLAAALRCAFTLARRVDRLPTVSGDFEKLAPMMLKALENGGGA
jgi:MoxR-like ATPase